MSGFATATCQAFCSQPLRNQQQDSTGLRGCWTNMGRRSRLKLLPLFVLLLILGLTSAESGHDVFRLKHHQANEAIHKALETLGLNLESVKDDTKLHQRVPAHSPDSDSLRQIREIVRQKFDLYVNQVREVHGLDAEEQDGDGDSPIYPGAVKRRGRRAVIKADNVLPGRRRRNITEHNSVGSQVVRVIYPLNPQPFSTQTLVDFTAISSRGHYYICVLEATDSGTYTLIYATNKDMKTREIARHFTPGAHKLEAYEIQSQIYILPVEYNETSSHPMDAGSVLFRFDPISEKLTKEQTIDTAHATAVHFWTGTGEEANDVYLAVGPEFQLKSRSRSFEVEVSIYRWQGAYFDYVYYLHAKNPQAIRHAQILSTGYLGIANFQDNTGSTSINSEIFRYSHKQSKYISFQKIRTQGAKSLEFFGVISAQQEDFFLAIANQCAADSRGKRNYQVKSHIFKYGLDRFIPFQSFQTYGAFQFLSVKTESRTFLVLGEITGIRVFQYNGWKFIQTNKYVYESESLNPNLIQLRPFPCDTQPCFSVSSLDAGIQNGVYAMALEKKKDYNDITADFEQECRKAVAKIKGENVPRILEDLEYAPKRTDPEITLKSQLLFTNQTYFKQLYGKTLRYRGVNFDATLSKELAKRDEAYDAVADELQGFRERVKGLILRNEDRAINTKLHFERLSYYGSSLKSRDVTVEKLNGHRLSDILPNLIHLNRNYSFESVTIDKLVTDQNINVRKLNEDFLADFALKSSETGQTFREENKFLGLVKANSGFNVHGRLDGVDLKNIDFLLRNGNQSFYGDINVRRSAVNNLVTETVNGVDLGYFMREGVRKSWPALITGAKYFEDVSVTNFQADGKISGFNIEELLAKAIVTNGKPLQEFQGRETSFEFLETKSITVGNNKLNEKWNLEEFVSISSGYYSMESLEMLYDTRVEDLLVNKSLNRILVTESGELDLIHRYTPKLQQIASKVLEGIHLQKDSAALGLVDDVNLTDWSHEKRIALHQSRVRVGNFAPKGTLRVDEGIHIEKYGRFSFEGEDVARLLENSLLLNATELPYSFRGSITFDSLKVHGNTEVRTVNKLSPSDWLTQNEESETIVVRGQKNFNGDLTLLTSSYASGLFYTQKRFPYGGQGQEIFGQLQDLLIDGVDQTIQGNTVFESLLTVDNLVCPSLVLNGIPFQNLLLVNSNQTIEGSVQFTKPVRVLDSFKVHGDLEVGRLNGIQLQHVLNDTLKTRSSRPQTFKAAARFQGGLSVENFGSEGNVGGYNLPSLISHIVRKDRQGFVEGSLTFARGAKVLKEGIKFTGTLNGIGHADWGQGFLLKSKLHQVVHTPVEFKSLSATNVTVAANTVSGVNIVTLAEQTLLTDEGGFLGVATFTGNLFSDSGLNVRTHRVNGYNIAKDLLLVSGKNPQVVTGTKTFLDDWRIDESLNVIYLAGVDYNQAAKFAFGKTELRDNLRIKGNLNLKREPFFQAAYNGEEWSDIVGSVWWIDEPVVIQSQANFDTLTLEEGGTLKGTLNGIDLRNLEMEYLSQSRDQRLTGKITFESGVTFKDLKTSKVQLNGKINGINLDEFRSSVFLHGVEQTVEFSPYFSELSFGKLELEETSLVGGIDLDKVTLRIHGQNIFESEVTLEELKADEIKLANGTRLNGIDISDWIENSVKASENAVIDGNVEILKADFQYVEVSGLVDGRKFSENHILTLSGNQLLQGTTKLKEGEKYIRAKAFNITTGIVNNINLQLVLDELVLNELGDSDLIVTGEKTFTQPLYTESLVSEGYFQGYNISEQIGGLKPQAYLSSYFNESLEERYKSMGQLALDLHDVADRRGVFLDYFDLVKRYSYEREVIAAVKTTLHLSVQTLFITLWKKEEKMSRLVWTSLSDFGEMHECQFSGVIRDFTGIERRGQTFLVVSISSLDESPVYAVLESQHTKTGYAELEKASSKHSRVFILKSQAGNWVVHQLVHGHDFRGVTALSIFESSGDVRKCAAVLALEKEASGGRALILCFDQVTLKEVSSSEDDAAMEVLQTLPAYLPSVLKSLSTLAKTFLLVGNGAKEQQGEVIDVWTHTPGATKFSKESCIPTVNLQSIDLIDGVGGNVLLAIASGTVDSSPYPGAVSIYRYSEAKKTFGKIQLIGLQNPVAVHFQNLEPVSTQQLLYVQAVKGLHVYSYKGLSGFVLEHVLPTTPLASILETTAHFNDRIFSTHALVASSTELQIFKGELNGLLQYEFSKREE